MPDPTRRRRFNRRTLITGAGATLLAGGFAVGAQYGANYRPARDWEDLGGRPLRVLASRDDTANGQRRLLIDQWNAWHRGHEAEMVELPPIADLQFSAVHAALQAGDSDVDVVELDVPWIAEFAKAGHLEPIEEPDTEGFLPHPLQTGRVDGDLYALPFHTNVGMLYYREGDDSDYATGTLSPTEARSISDWGVLRETIGLILDESPGFEGGIAMQLAPYEGFTVNVWEYLLANGVAVDGETGEIDFGEGSDAAGVLEELSRDLHEEVREGAHVILPEALQYNEAESLAAFQEGRVPFLRHWPQVIRTLQGCELDFEVGVVPMPGGVLGGAGLAVSRYSQRRHASRALIEFLTDPISQQLLFERGSFAPTRHEPYFDAIAQTANTVPASGDRCESAAGTKAEADELYEALTGQGPGRRPAVERYTQFSLAFRDALHPQLANEAAPDLAGLDRRLQDAIEGK